MKQVSFHEDARAELAEASHYYEDRVPGLGQALIDDVENAVSEILGHPKACKLISKNLRRKVLSRFPYGLIYTVEPDRIRIMALAHYKRRPEYWRYRLT